MADAKKTVLITGANRGLGYGLAKKFLSRPNTIVIGTCRKPEAATELKALRTAEGSSLTVVKLDGFSETDPADAISEVKGKYGVSHLDILIANAGISLVFPQAHEVHIPDFLEHFQVNVIAVLRIYKEAHPLLMNSKRPMFITLGSEAASLSEMEKRNFPNSVYGASKCTLNYITLKAHFENPNLIAFPLDPGWAQTDLGNDGARTLGLESAEIPVDLSVNGMIKVIDNATRENTSGKFMAYDGTTKPW